MPRSIRRLMRKSDELDRLHEQTGPATRVCVALPHHEPGRARWLTAQDEGPREVVGRRRSPHRDAAAQDQGLPLFHEGHDQAGLGMESDLRADVDGLPFRNYPIGAVDVAAHEVLEEVVAVETAAPLSKLGDPLPDTIGGGANRHRPRGRQVRTGHELIARKRHARLLLGGAPPQRPCPHESHGGCDRASHGDSATTCEAGSHWVLMLPCQEPPPPDPGSPKPGGLERRRARTRRRRGTLRPGTPRCRHIAGPTAVAPAI